MPQCISARLVYVLLIHSYTRTDLYVITKQKTLGPRGKWWKGRKIAEGRESKGVSSSESVLKVTYGNVEGGGKNSPPATGFRRSRQIMSGSFAFTTWQPYIYVKIVNMERRRQAILNI